MALISAKHTQRLIPPHEQDSWFDVRPIRAGDYEGLVRAGNEITFGLDLASKIIVAWSYEEPLTRENVANLDLDTYTWLQGEVLNLSGVRPEPEKKASTNGSLPRRAAAARDTQKSSAT